MGGNALKVPTRRVGIKEYKEIKEELINFFLRKGYKDVRSIPHIANKESFGDLDLLLDKPQLSDLDEVLKEMGTKEIYHNSSVVSFEYKGFQVDLIHCAPETLDIARVYFSYNDIGMLIGILARRVRCKYSSEGLFFLYFTEGKAKKWEIFLTLDPRRIFNFLGLDFDRFQKGFKNFEEITDFIIQSNLFDTESFTNQEEWNHYKRKRNQKRPIWQYVIQTLYERPKMKSPRPTRPESYVSRWFPEKELESKLLSIKQREERRQKVKQKFNGKKLQSLTGLEGKKLSEFMSKFKSNFVDFEQFILNNSQIVIDEEVKRFLWHKTN
jgi:hypothetical protein